jgi:hypothetical protein
MNLIKFLIAIFLFNLPFSVNGQQGAPALNLYYNFTSSKAVLIMNKTKIVQSVNTSYFSSINYTGGYAGLQQTPDNSYGNSNILISSLWDTNTLTGALSRVEYTDIKTVGKRFDWEGNGCFTINPYSWRVNLWYNIVIRAWNSNGRLYIATFVNDETSSKWLHSTTMSIPFAGDYLSSGNSAFLENWDGANPAWNGSVVRSVYYKDCWKLNLRDKWEKSSSARLEAYSGGNSIQLYGNYYNSFNGYYDTNENAYFLQHGGNTVPSAAFNGGRSLGMPAQAQQGTKPSLTIGTIQSVNSNYNTDTKETEIKWIIDDTKSPQLSAKIEILDPFGMVISTFQDTLPQRRNYSTHEELPAGIYSVRLSIIDIFNQPSEAVTGNFTVPGPFLLISSDSLSIAALQNSTNSFEILSNTNWNAMSNQPWLTISTHSGSSNASITVTAQTNPAITARTAKISVSATGVATQTISITQDRADAVLSVSADTLLIASQDNSTISFDIISNTNWSVTSDQDWLIARNPIGSNNSTVILIATENTTSSKRKATLTVSGAGVNEQIITAIQEGGTSGFSDIYIGDFKIFPNPTRGEVNIITPSESSEIRVYNMNGQIVRRLYKIEGQTSCFFTIDYPGIYFLAIISKNFNYKRKLIVTGQ